MRDPLICANPWYIFEYYVHAKLFAAGGKREDSLFPLSTPLPPPEQNRNPVHAFHT